MPLLDLHRHYRLRRGEDDKVPDHIAEPAGLRYYAPAADGIDEEAWALLVQVATLCQRRKVRRLRRLLGRSHPGARLSVVLAYAMDAIALFLGDRFGASGPAERDIHSFVLRYAPILDGLTLKLTLEQIEAPLREMFGYASAEEREYRNTFVWAAALLGVAAERPVGEVLDGLRPRVAADVVDLDASIRKAVAREDSRRTRRPVVRSYDSDE